MTSTPVTILTKRSGNAADRPLTTTVQAGELALNFAGAENGLYFKDSAGAIRKVAGTHYGSSAPNSSPAGATGNSVGEVWVTSSAPYYLQVWTGASWQKVGAAFADVSTQANVTIASGALSANGAILASGALSADGAVLASGALSADGAILSSGALSANGAILASGALSANGAVLASGALSADGAILASGVITATGVPVAGIYTGGFPAVGDIGTLIYRNDAPSGLYISVNGGWALT